MENDKTFKKLLEGGIENTSPEFTQIVIERVKAHAALGSVNNMWTKVFRITFVIISFLVVVLSFLNASTQQIFDTYVKFPNFSGETIFWIMLYIFSFWMLIAISLWREKRKLFSS